MIEPPTGKLLIGMLADELGLNPKTIRYYEEIGLMPAPQRTAARYRLYGDADRERLRFILKARAIGLTLEEIREMLMLRGEGQRPCGHLLGLLDQKLAAVEAQLKALREFKADLKTLRAEAAEGLGDDVGVCSIIEHHRSTYPDPLPVTTLTRPPRRRSSGLDQGA